MIRDVETTHVLGLWWIVVSLLNIFGLWILGRLALRMGPFMRDLSMADTIGNIYGKYPRIVAALVGICSCIVIITSQINVISQTISMSMGWGNPLFMTTIATLILIFYSTFGGIRAVTFTDVLQFLTFSIIIPILVWFVFVKVGKPVSAIVPILGSYTKFQFSNVFYSKNKLLGMLSLFLSFVVSYIKPGVMQRVYMSSSPVQAQRVFSYAAVFSFVIQLFIILIGLFVFVGAPDLPKESVWDHIMAHVPSFFKGFIVIALLSMTMSTADSCLNACSVMVSHDIVKILQQEKEMVDTRQLKIARRTTLVVGLLAMLLAFHSKDLLKLLYWSINSLVPIVTAPFILAVFGFRGTSRTALIGMATGLLAILAWNKWIQPLADIDGSFLAAIANALAMLAAHYFFKQPEGVGWVGPDDQFKQMQQERARKRAEQKEAIKNAWANRKITLSNLVPNHTTMICIGIYTTITSLLAYFIVHITNHSSSLIFQLFLSACFIGYPFFYDISKKIRALPRWFIGLCWLMFLAVYLPRNLVWYWWNLMDPIFNTSFFLTHCTVILWVLPLYLGIGVVATTLLASIYPIVIGLSFSELSSLFPLFIASLLIFAMTIISKVKQAGHKTRILYFEHQEKIRNSQQLKASLYDAALVPSNGANPPKGYGFILNQVVRKVEESISFLDDHTTLYKQDFQSVINKFYDWVDYLNRREKAKKHALLQPAKITFDKLIRKVEVALSQEVVDPPRLLVEKVDTTNGRPCAHIVCDINQVVYLLVQAVLRIAKLVHTIAPVVRIQLHPTSLQCTQSDPIDNHYPTCTDFPATALVVSQAATSVDFLPKVKAFYADVIDVTFLQKKQEVPPSIDLQMQTISTIIGAHYGYLEAPVSKKPHTMLLVLPNDVMDILGKMAVALPLDSLTLEMPVTPKEQADSMMALMQFHDYVCKSLSQEDPIDVKTISGLLLLLRKHFGFKRHASGQLFYVRAVGIASLVVEWVFHSPKVIYASLLYELVRRTCLPLSYIKEHYNLGVYAFVLNVVGIDKRQDLEHPSLLYVQNRLKQAIKEEHVQLSVLFIKLAERLYDLRHAAGYVYLTEVQHMAQETLATDVKLAHTYLDPEIAKALENAAKEALKVVNTKKKGIHSPLWQK